MKKLPYKPCRDPVIRLHFQRRSRDGTSRMPRDATIGQYNYLIMRMPRDETVGRSRDGTFRRPRDGTRITGGILYSSYPSGVSPGRRFLMPVTIGSGYAEMGLHNLTVRRARDTIGTNHGIRGVPGYCIAMLLARRLHIRGKTRFRWRKIHPEKPAFQTGNGRGTA